MKRLVFMAMALSLLSACVNTGVIEGVSESEPVQFEYEQGAFDNDGLLSVTMPDGERYSGKFVQISSSTSGDDWEIGESSDDDSWIIKGSETVSSSAEALLIGSRGNTMKCNFQLSNADFGIGGGGIGQCKTSIGQTAAIAF